MKTPSTRTRLLVSVRNFDEALVAARHGAGFIDLKEPRDGALGGLSVSTVRGIVAGLRAQNVTLPVSATIGDVPMHDLARITACVRAVAACRVDYVKVGIERSPQARAVLSALAAIDHPIVPVFIADRGLDFDHVAHAVALRFPGVMVDTADKLAGSLFDVLDAESLGRFLQAVRQAGALAGVAGALRLQHVPQLKALAPDFAGFRTAVCVADRASALDPARLKALAAALRAPPAAAGVTP